MLFGAAVELPGDGAAHINRVVVVGGLDVFYIELGAPGILLAAAAGLEPGRATAERSILLGLAALEGLVLVGVVDLNGVPLDGFGLLILVVIIFIDENHIIFLTGGEARNLFIIVIIVLVDDVSDADSHRGRCHRRNQSGGRCNGEPLFHFHSPPVV